jgi:spore coat protein H
MGQTDPGSFPDRRSPPPTPDPGTHPDHSPANRRAPWRSRAVSLGVRLIRRAALVIAAWCLPLAGCGEGESARPDAGIVDAAGAPDARAGDGPAGDAPAGDAPAGDSPPGADAHVGGDGPPASDTPAADVAKPSAAALFDESRVVTFDVSFPPGEWERLLTLRTPAAERWVRCSLRFEGETFADAACRRKGNMFDWDIAKKPQFLVRFNYTDDHGRFRGLRRLNFEHFEGPPAPIRDRLAMWAMRQAGVDAPRVNHARVTKDGQPLGLYMNVEVVDREFLEDHFGDADADGNLWESGTELETNEAANDRTRLQALLDLIEREPDTGDHAALFAALDAMMDVDQVLREMAAETALVASDNFSNGEPRNFYYYEHPARGFMVLPWDLDQTLTELPPQQDPFEPYPGTAPHAKLRRLMNQHPAWRARYVDLLVDVRDKVLTALPAQVDAICAQIADAVRADTNRQASYEAFQADCAQVKASIPARVDALRVLLGR